MEQQWQENLRTVEGKILHTHVHDAEFHEKRNDVIYARAMAVSSASLGVSGECDLVEFHASPKGIPIFRYAGTYEVVPVEYKRGKSKEDASDRMQLVVQAMCLEEMLCCEIPYGFLYYGETNTGKRLGSMKPRNKRQGQYWRKCISYMKDVLLRKESVLRHVIYAL